MPLFSIRIRSLKKHRTIFIVLIVLAIAVVAIALGKSRGVQAWLMGQRGFAPDALDQRILVEPGVKKAVISLIHDSLDACIDIVERAHGQAFPNPVHIFLTSTQASFNKRIGALPQAIARGAVFADRLFLSPRAFATKSSLAVLKHELSHLHFRQVLGTAYTTEIPGWFQEGMAVFVANGGGAEAVSEQEAIEAIVRGERLRPEEVGSAFPRGAAAHGLGHHMFYRQAELFVANLADLHPASFRRFIAMLLAGRRFQLAFEAAFDQTVSEAWESFIAGLQ